MSITGGEHPKGDDDQVLGVLTGQVKVPVPEQTSEDTEEHDDDEHL